jgi:PAS domain S-box-containing protein
MDNLKEGKGSSVHRFGRTLSIVLILLFVILAISLYVFDFGSSTIFDPPGLLPLLNLLFLFICPMVVWCLAVKGYLESGSIGLITLGSGVFSMAVGSLIAGFLLQSKGSNAVITIHNISAFLAGVLHFTGATLAFVGFESEQDTRKRKFKSVTIFTGIFAFLVILTFGVLKGILPSFFVQGQGPTLIRQVILGIATLSFLMSGLLFTKLYRNSRSNFLYWYTAALFLISIGLGCILIQKSFGSPIGWLGRIAQYTAGLYMVAAVFSGARELGIKISRFDKVLEKFFHNRFQVLLAERTDELALTNDQLRREINERKQAEEALRESENRFQIAMAATKDGLYDWNLITNEIYYSPGWKRMIGYADHELPNDFSVWENLTDAEDAKRSWQMQNELIHKQRDRFKMEFEMKHKDGHWVDILSRATAIFDKDGKAIRIIGTHVDISERKQAEKATREKEEALRLSLDAAKAGTWTWNIETGEVVWDDQMQKIFGLEPGTFKGTFEAWKERVHPDDMKTAERITLNALERGERYNFEYRVKGRSGEWNIINAQASVVKDISGKPVKMSGFATDITDRKRAEEALLNQKDFLQKAQEIGHIGTWELDIEKNELLWTDENYRIFGLPIGTKLTYGIFLDCVHPDDREYVDKKWKAAFDKKPYDIEHRLLVDGDIKWVREKAELHFDETGKCIRGTGVTQDITERKQAEETLRESEDFLNRTGDMAKVGGWEVDLNTMKVIWTRTTGRIHELPDGYFPDLEEAISYYHPGDQDHVRQCVQRAIESSEPFDFTVRLITAKGRERWVRALGQPIFDSGSCVRLSGTFQDITERLKLEEELRQSQKMEAVGTLAGGIAHDFNNILAVILGNAELASDDIPDWNPASKSLKAIHQASIRARDMVKHLLAFSRKSGEVNTPINIEPIIKESMEMLRSAVPTSIAFDQHISDGPCNILGDAAQISQVMMNLATNAAHAMAEEGGLLEVTLEKVGLQEEKSCFNKVLPPGAYVRLKMRDTGEGMEPKTMARIFEPYYTTKELGKGTGMGLSVIHGIVKRHGGGIWVESEIGKGAVFEIYFPALVEMIEKEKEPDGEIKGGSESILFVDDEESMVNLNRQRLERLGYQVKSTTKPVEALEWFRADPNQFDVIITDMTMPRMTGDRLTAEVLKIRPQMPVIICTGYSERMSEKDAEALGVQYIEKPTDTRNLAAALREALEGK